jgi:hypothetical protein
MVLLWYYLRRNKNSYNILFCKAHYTAPSSVPLFCYFLRLRAVHIFWYRFHTDIEQIPTYNMNSAKLLIFRMLIVGDFCANPSNTTFVIVCSPAVSLCQIFDKVLAQVRQLYSKSTGPEKLGRH